MNTVKLPSASATELPAQERLTHASPGGPTAAGPSCLDLGQHRVRRRLLGDRRRAGGQASLPPPAPVPPRRAGRASTPATGEAPRRMRSSYGAARSDALPSPPRSVPRPLLCCRPELSSLPDPGLSTPRLQSCGQCRPASRAPAVAMVNTEISLLAMPVLWPVSSHEPQQKTDRPVLTVDDCPSLSKRWDRTWDLPNTRLWA
ncbi:uncharacterized protein LOC116629167 [Phoca vitulina]|uniref:uncharacterized protein LOC116629167 n=1 Tax=Phoca vitulina TaxID=9720 RepID=UPI001395ECD3|nr:uncharacterized protein LOC116629167 [Phoca vitulina]